MYHEKPEVHLTTLAIGILYIDTTKDTLASPASRGLVLGTEGSGHFRVKIYAKPLPMIFQLYAGEVGLVFHTELHLPTRLVHQVAVQVILAIEHHVLPADRAEMGE
jgi:hypothetical protein